MLVLQKAINKVGFYSSAQGKQIELEKGQLQRNALPQHQDDCPKLAPCQAIYLGQSSSFQPVFRHARLAVG